MTSLGLPTPIAIVGAGCRFPGGAHNLESLWELLAEGRNAWSETPAERFNARASYHPVRGSNAAHTHIGGHFLDQDVGAFDAGFFGISSDEANAMDPQQRLQLEVAYEALENAGITVENIKGSETGVYIATFTHDYENMIYRDVLSLPKYFMTGVGQAIVSNRISYTFDLKGPSMTLDTGCSGSMVALHQACQSLRLGETNMGLVGGTNLILSSDTMIPMDALHLLNCDGKCYSFDSRGAGYGRGEGVAMIVVKRLEDALRCGDPIRAIIRNTAIGQDGKTSGITLPSGPAQQQLIRSTYASVSLDPSDVGYVEAHGTGTVAGDLTEMDVIEKVFCTNRKHPLFVGSIKANVGHLESTSGLAGVIKTLLILEKSLVPSTPSLKVLKEKLQTLSSDIKIPQALEAWYPGVIKRASINSFGYGGANAHAIIDAPDASSIISFQSTIDVGDKASHSLNSTFRIQLFSISAKSECSLQSALRNLHAWAGSRGSKLDLVDLAYTLASRRSAMTWRYTFTACTRQMILDVLESVSFQPIRVAKSNLVTYIFGGQGAQWYAMGRGLFCIPYFKMSLTECASILRDLGASWSLFEELTRDQAASRLDESEFGQPATTILQIGLVDLLRSLGVTPNEVLGHSSGEIAAAYASGALKKAAAIKVAYHRSFLAERSRSLMNTSGSMLAVALGEEEISPYINRVSTGRMVVACCNSPLSTTVSGDSEAIVSLQDSLNRFAIPSRRLNVDTAYHSHHMEAVAEEYLQALSSLESQSKDPDIKFYSSVTGGEKTSNFGPSYWLANLVSKVRFREALEGMCHNSREKNAQISLCHNFIEIGPHNTLTSSVKQTLKHLKLDNFRYNCISVSRKDRDSHTTFLQAIGSLFEQGFALDLDAANSLEGFNYQRRVITDLPPYPFDHSVSYWHESRLHKEHRVRSHPYSDLLGLRVPGDTFLEPTWRHLISIETLPWLRDHAIDGRIIFPASGYIAMAIEAKTQIYHDYFADPGIRIRRYMLRNLVFSKTLEITESNSVEVHLALRYPMDDAARKSTAWQEFHISSVSFEGAVKEHCHGYVAFNVSAGSGDATIGQENHEQHIAKAQSQILHTVRRAHYPEFDPTSIYKGMRSNGHHWGPSFARITSVRAGDSEAIGTVAIPDIAQSMPGRFMQPHVIHPATLDALIHSGLIIFTKTYGKGLMFPVAIAEVVISADALARPNETVEFVTTLVQNEFSSANTTITAFEKNSQSEAEFLVHIKDCILKGTPNSSRDLDDRCARACYQLEWGADIDICRPLLTTSGLEDEFLRNLKIAKLNQLTYHLVGICLDQTEMADVQKSHQEYFCWMRQVHELKHYDSIAVASEDPCHCLSNLGVEGEAVQKIGSNLKSIITGHCDPLSLLLEDDLLSRLYAEDTAHLRCYAHLVEFMKCIVFKQPGLRVLEIGAGTGGASLPLISALRSNDKSSIRFYHFTDVSSGFFEHAHAKLEGWEDFLDFKTLDIGRDPVHQGFFEADYDVVLASNALHTTESIDKAITNARRLLKPGGRLVLIEITKLASFTNVIFGGLPGWYMERNDGRKGSPILSVEEWDSRLRQGSFSGVDLAVPDCSGSAQQMNLMVSKAVSPDPSRSDVSIICNHKHENAYLDLAQTLSELIELRHGRVDLRDLPLKEIKHNEIYIVIDSAEYSLFTAADSWLCASMTKLLERAKNVLWVVLSTHPGTLRRASDVEFRVPRVPEHKNQYLKLVNVDVPQFEHLPSLCSKIFEIMLVSFCGPSGYQSQETEYVYTEEAVLIPRVVHNTRLRQTIGRGNTGQVQTGPYRQKDRPIELDIVPSNAANEDLRFAEHGFKDTLAPSEIEVEVHAWGIDSQAVLAKATLMLREFSGRVVSVGSDIQDMYRIGDRVCCWGENSHSSFSRVDAMRTCHLPDSIPFSIAASIPITYSTAYHGIVELASLAKEQTILIHAATESTGEAAVRIAQHTGARVIISTDDIRTEDLANMFGLPREYVLLRTSDITSHVHTLTRGHGVDVICSTVKDESFEEDWACLKAFGVYVELREPGGNVNRKGTAVRPNKDMMFCSVTFNGLMEHRLSELREHMTKILSFFQNGLLKTLHHVGIGDISELANVYKSIQRGSITGKQVLQISEDSTIKWTAKRKAADKFSPNASLILAGDLGQWGLDICHYVANRDVHYVALVAWSDRELEQLAMFERELRRLGVDVRVISLDLSDQKSKRESVLHALEGWPAVKGVIHADILQEKLGSEYTKLDDSFATNQSSLRNIFRDLDLDFFVKLSPCTILFGGQGEHTRSTSHIVSRSSTLDERSDRVHLLIGVSKGFKLISEDPQPTDNTDWEAMLPTTRIDLHNLLDFATSSEAKNSTSKVIIVGFDMDSLNSAGYDQALKNPILNHIRHSEELPKTQRTMPSSTAVEESLADAQAEDEARRIVTTALQHQISAVTFDYDVTDLQTAVADFGLDSLIVFRLRTWIFQAFRADLEPQEITGATNIITLADLVLERTTFTQYRRKTNDASNCNTEQAEIKRDPAMPSNLMGLPRQPLPLLPESLQAFLNAAQPFCSEEEFRDITQATEEFKVPDGIGNILHHRLVEREEDPQIENWLGDLYLTRRYLSVREPLVAHQSYFGTHPFGRFAMKPAERAALVTLVVFRFKKTLESRKLVTQYLSGQAIDQDSYQWLFNACREPCVGTDRIHKYAHNDYIVVMRRGHVYKILLQEGNHAISFNTLKAFFERIREFAPKTMSWLSILTADGRDEWAKFRSELLGINEENKMALQTIEAAAFVVCLDEAKPTNAEERFRQYLFGDGSNRWYDKTLQIVICDNGVSATVCEHAALDGLSVEPLHKHINDAIFEFERSPHSNFSDKELASFHSPDPVPLTSNAPIDDYVRRFFERFQTATLKYSFAHAEIANFGNDFFSMIKCPVLSGIQLAIQLASHRFFGYSPPALETVSMAPFRKGRVEVHHVIQPRVAEFLAAATESSAPVSRLRIMAFEAAKAHAKSLSKSSQGHGFSRHLLAMEWMVRDGEPTPALFKSPVYARMKPGKVVTSAFKSGWVEGGFVYPVLDSILVYLDIKDQSVSFSIFGHNVSARDFHDHLQTAAREIKTLLNSEDYPGQQILG